jgi:hypothetical protein
MISSDRSVVTLGAGTNSRNAIIATNTAGGEALHAKYLLDYKLERIE